MRLHRFYIEQKIDGEAEIILTDPELLNQLGKVFRFKSGDRIIIFDGTGFEYEAEIILISKKEVILKPGQGQSLSDGRKGLSLSERNVSLYLSLIKKNNFEWASEKCTEIGVTEIHPIISERSEKKDLNLERVNKIVKEASEQSGRMTLPQVFPIKPLDLAVSQAVAEGKECVAFHTDSTVTEHNRLFNRPRRQNGTPSSSDEGDSSKPSATFVGPEGGFTENEIELFKKNNFKILSLGPNILRAETAAIVAIWYSLHR